MRTQLKSLIVGVLVIGSLQNVYANPKTLVVEGGIAEKENDYRGATVLYDRATPFVNTRDEAVLGLVRAQLHDNQIDAASKLLGDYIATQNPFFVEGRIALAKILATQKRYDEALTHINHALSLRPGFTDAIAMRADVYFSKRDFEHAIQEYTSILKLSPQNFDARLNRGKSYFERQEYAKAIEDAQNCLSQRQHSVDARYLLGSAQIETNEFGPAETNLVTVLRHSPTEVRVNDRLGDLYMKTGKYTLAGEYYKVAVDGDEARLDIGMKLGKAYQSSGQRELAMNEFKRQLEIHPSHDPAVYQIVKMHLEDNRGDLAGHVLSSYTTRFPNKAWAFTAYSKLLISINQLDWAEGLSKRVMPFLSKNAAPDLVSAYVFHKKGEVGEAIRVLEFAKKNFPSDARITYNLAVLYDTAEKNKKAAEFYREVKDNADLEQKAKVNLVVLLNKMGETQEAETLASELRSTYGSGGASREIASVGSSSEYSKESIRSGETLSEFSNRVYGTSKRWKEIFDWNRDVVSDPSHVPAGTVLKLRTVKNTVAKSDIRSNIKNVETYSSVEEGSASTSSGVTGVVTLADLKPYREMELP